MSMKRTAALAVAAMVIASACTVAADPDPTATSTSTVPSTTSTTPPAPTTTVALEPPNGFELGRTALQSLSLSAGDDVDLDDLGFAPTLLLGVHNVLSVERTLDDLSSADGWTIGVSEYAGFSGPFNPLEVLRSGGPLLIEEGSHPHCAGPPLDPPSGFEDATRVHAQPKNVDSCIDWFSVDLWIVAGQIQAVTLELFGP